MRESYFLNPQYDYDKIMEILREKEEYVANLYYSDGKMWFVYDENGRKIQMNSVPYRKINVGFEMELYVEIDDDIMMLKKGYHSGSRNIYRGGKEIFSAIERDGSLDSNGMEFITKRHKANDKRFFYWFNVFRNVLEYYRPYVNDDCGGHMHISGWTEDEAEYVFGALRAYEPMLIVLFGNGENGVKRENGYGSITQIIKMRNYGRSNINRISDGHFELRFFDGEIEPFNWFMREMFVDGIVHIGRSMRKIGIGRYVPVDAWYDTYYKIDQYNDYSWEQAKRMIDEFVILLRESHYPNYEIIKRFIYDRNYAYEDFKRYIEIKNGKIIISVEV